MNETEHTTNFFPVSKLFTDAELETLIESGAAVSHQYWLWGDLTSRKVIEAQAVYGEHPGVLMSLYNYIGSLIGKSARSVRLYRELAEFYPADVRAAYQPLPFDTFKLAKSFGPGWKTVLDRAIGFVEDHGRLPTREWLENAFRADLLRQGGETADETPNEWESHREAAFLDDITGDDALTVDPETGVVVDAVHVASRHRAILASFSTMTRAFAGALSALPLRAETRQMLQVALDSMEDALSRLRAELED